MGRDSASEVSELGTLEGNYLGLSLPDFSLGHTIRLGGALPL